MIFKIFKRTGILFLPNESSPGKLVAFIHKTCVLSTQFTKLPPPIGNCDPDEDFRTCVLKCTTKYVIEQCNCTEFNMPGRGGAMPPPKRIALKLLRVVCFTRNKLKTLSSSRYSWLRGCTLFVVEESELQFVPSRYHNWFSFFAPRV